MIFKSEYYLSFWILLASFAYSQAIYTWEEFPGQPPNHAFLGSRTPDLYIARIPNEGSKFPGTLYADTLDAVTIAKNKKITVSDGFSVLCDPDSTDFSWVPMSSNDVQGEKLIDLVVGGVDKPDNLYIGKVFHEDVYKIGPVYPATNNYLKGLRVWQKAGGVYVAHSFEVLKYVGKRVLLAKSTMHNETSESVA